MTVPISRPALTTVHGIDHVVIRVDDLDVAEALYRRLGFVLTPRGFHTGRGSANHTTPFSGGTYVELIRYPASATGATFGDKPAGPVAVALHPTTSAALHAELSARGHDVAEARDLARPVEIDGETREARFLNVSLPSGGVPYLRLFACQHLTRDLVWRPEWQSHANGVTGVAGLLAIDPDPRRHAGFYAELFGAAALTPAADGLKVALGGGGTLSILTPAGFIARFGATIAPDQVGFVGIELRVNDLAATARTLAGAGIAATAATDGALVLSAQTTGGAVLAFAQA